MGRDVGDLCDEVAAEATVVDFDTDEGRFILFRLLLCHPWAARLAPSDTSFYSAGVMGELFDVSGLRNSLLRPLADSWCRWCIYWSWRLGDAWRLARAHT